MKEDRAVPWMACEDMITRLKDELILEAIDILHAEMKAGHIDISGYVSLLPDKSNELQRDMYMIGNLVAREQEIMEQYARYLGDMKETDPQKVKGIEELKKFMMAVGAISMLIKFSHIAEKWADDTGKYAGLRSVEEILANTARMADDRIEVLDFALSSSKFLGSEALSQKEIKVLRDVIKKLKH